MNFVMQKLTLEIADEGNADKVLKKIAKIVRRVEPDCEMIERG